MDDLLPQASLNASHASAGALAAQAVVWQHWFSEKDLTWTLARGRVGYKNGDLMVKGEGSTPVILSPKEPAIDWRLYEAVEVRMAAAGGHEVKIRIGDFEARQKLGPPNQYNVYRFPVHVDAPKGMRPLGIMPTDDLYAVAAIRSIRLIPRAADFPLPAGRESLGKRDEFRSVVYAHAPSAIVYSVNVPRGARLHFGAGIAANDAPVSFHVSVEGVAGELYSRNVADAEAWEDADVDLSRFAGRSVRLVLRTTSAREGAVGLWANPLITSAAPRTRPNVLIYLIDTLRADHASLYGYGRDTTPFLKKLAASGLVFDDCQAQSTWTKSSVASLMTSLYSFTHGIVNDADTIPPGAATIAGELRGRGYVTASIVANPFVGRATGLQRGFDYMLEFPTVFRHHTEAEDRATDSAALNKVVIPWLEKHRDEPFFLYAHSTDPHAPYRPPPPFEQRWANPAETAAFNREYGSLSTDRDYGGGSTVNRAMCRKAGIDPDAFIRRAVDRYDGEVLHNDSQFQALVEKMKQLGILDNTLIVVLSDHGEEFWDHGWTAHGHTLYQELTHCALLMWNPRLLGAPRRVPDPVQVIDIMPTVLDLLGAPVPQLAEGQTLAPLVRGQAFHRRTPVMTSRFARPGALPDSPVAENRTDTFAFVDAKWKLIYRDKSRATGLNRTELYDRAVDRGEQRNVAAEHPREVEMLMKQVGSWIEAQNKLRVVLGHGTASQMDRQTIQQLRSMGYLGGSQ